MNTQSAGTTNSAWIFSSEYSGKYFPSANKEPNLENNETTRATASHKFVLVASAGDPTDWLTAIFNIEQGCDEIYATASG